MAYSVHKEENAMKELDILKSDKLGITEKDSIAYLRTDSRTLVIGLGGMGQETVCRLKSALTRKIGVLNPSMIQFLILDTASTELQLRLDEQEVEDSEIVKMHSDNLAQLFRPDNPFMPQNIKDLLPENFTADLNGAGANQVRLAGRLTASDQVVFNDIVQKISDSVETLRNAFTGTLYIYIISGIGGGTGSGLVVDVSYLARHICVEDLQLSAESVKVIGSIYLPNVHMKRPDKLSTYRNGYAALKEIDYFMSIEALSETYTTRFPGGVVVSSNKNIFDSCTLIGGTDSNIVLKDPREHAMNACIENMSSLITNTGAKKSDGNTNVFFVDSFLNNYNAQLTTALNGGDGNDKIFQKNANYKYNSVGAGTIYFPYAKILEYVSGSIYGEMIKYFQEKSGGLDQEAADEFEKTVGLDPDSLIEPQVQAFKYDIQNVFEDREFKGRWQGQRDELGKITGEIRAEIKSKMADYHLESLEELTKTAAARSNQNAMDIFKNDLKGPYYLKNLMESRSGAGGGVVGFFEKISGYHKAADDIGKKSAESQTKKENELSVLIQSMKNKKRSYDRNLEVYKEILTEIYEHELKKELAGKLHREYYTAPNTRTGICHSLRRNIEQNQLYFCDIIEYLGTVMSENVKLSKPSVYEVPKKQIMLESNMLGMDDDTFRNIQDKVQADINKTLYNYKHIEGETSENLQIFASKFLGEIAANSELWRLKEERREEDASCIGSFRKFIINAFPEYANCSFAKYLEIAYKNESDEDKKALVRQIVNALVLKADLTFSTWSNAGFEKIPTLNFKYVILPKEMDPNNYDGLTVDWVGMFRNAMSNRSGVTPDQIMYSEDDNSIFCYNLYMCLPLWMHSQIKEFEQQYTAPNKGAGIHTNESSELFPQYKEYPPLFLRETWDQATVGGEKYVNEYELDYQNKLDYVFEKSINYGIIVAETNGNYAIRVPKKPLPNEAKPTILNIKNAGGKFTVDKDTIILDKTLSDFADKYIEDSDTADGLIPIEGFYAQLCGEYGGFESLAIAPNHPQAGGMFPNSPENAFKLLRKQMKLSGKLLALFPVVELMVQKIEEINDGIIKERAKEAGIKKIAEQRAQYCKFMAYKVVFSEDDNKKWFFLNDKNEKTSITNRLAVGNDPKISALKDEHMELASFIKFIERKDYKDITESLENEVNFIIDELVNERIKPDDFIASANEYKAAAAQALKKYDVQIRRNIDSLNPEEREIVDFYKELEKTAEDIIKDL